MRNGITWYKGAAVPPGPKEPGFPAVLWMKIAALQYSYSFPKDFKTYETKLRKLVKQLADEKVQLAVLPEYAGFEIASIPDWQKELPSYLHLFQDLSASYQMYICAGSQVVPTEKGTFNRSYFFAPNRTFFYQDKCMLTPDEVQEGILTVGDTVALFETPFGKVGICVCYDVEFPQFAEMLVNQGANLILVPSYTSTIHGFYRVLTSCRARALESQCYVVQSTLVGQTDVEIAFGAAAICSPIDQGFPEDGILAMGTQNKIETVTATLDFGLLEKVRTNGETRNYTDAQLLRKKNILFHSFDLC